LRSSLNDKAYLQIRRWIVRQQLRPGEQLKVANLAAALNMSRTPVREALSRLEQERLVMREPMKGFTVSAMDPAEINDLHEVREALEVLAARQAAGRLRPKTLQSLKQILQQSGELIKRGDKKGVLQLEQDFHLLILEASGNRHLAEIGQSILDRIWNLQRLLILTSDQLAESQRQHQDIYLALSRGEKDLVAKLMQEHMAFAGQQLLARLNDHGEALFGAFSRELDPDI